MYRQLIIMNVEFVLDFTFRRSSVAEVRLRSVCNLLHDDWKAVDVAFLCTIGWTILHTKKLRRCPHHIAVVCVFSNLRSQSARHVSHFWRPVNTVADENVSWSQIILVFFTPFKCCCHSVFIMKAKVNHLSSIYIILQKVTITTFINWLTSV